MVSLSNVVTFSLPGSSTIGRKGSQKRYPATKMNKQQSRLLLYVPLEKMTTLTMTVTNQRNVLSPSISYPMREI